MKEVLKFVRKIFVGDKKDLSWRSRRARQSKTAILFHSANMRRDLRNRAHAEGINVRVAARAVTVEISLQGFVALRHGEFVVRSREMIHADIEVAVTRSRSTFRVFMRENSTMDGHG